MTRRILLSYLTLAAFVLVVLEVPLALFFADRERERFTNAVAADATVLASLYEDALDQGDQAIDPDAAAAYSAEVAARVVVVDVDGISVVDTGESTGRDFSTRPEVATALQGTRAQGTRDSATLGTELLYVAVPIASGGEVHGALRITMDTSEVDHRIHRFWRGLVGLGVVVMGAVGVLGWTLATSVTRPLRSLQSGATRFAAGDLRPIPPDPGAPREVRDLAESMSVMAADLQAVLDRQQAFVADASHQLRTPLTALRLRLENLEHEVSPVGRADLEAAGHEITRLTGLVGQLLTLTRAGHGAAPARISLSDLVRERVEVWEALAEASGVSIRADVPAESVEVYVEPGAVEQVLDNLLDNALAVSGPGSSVEVTVRRRSAGGGVLTVADHGPGLTDNDKARALDRFWQGPRPTGGSGLGLAIVESIARAHGGGVSLADTAGGGLSVSVALGAQ